MLVISITPKFDKGFLILDYLRKLFEVNCAHLLKMYKEAASNFLSYK